MAGGEVAGLVLLILRHHVLANLLGIGATGVEAATLGRVGRRGNIALQLDPVHLCGGVRVGNGGEQCLGVRVQGIFE